jgi:hypothetical protein
MPNTTRLGDLKNNANNIITDSAECLEDIDIALSLIIRDPY